MVSLRAEIAAFESMKGELEADHMHAWVMFHDGAFVGAFADFETAALLAEERFDTEPCLIRQVGAGPIQLSGGHVFWPAPSLKG
jgi:hypothetical protein